MDAGDAAALGDDRLVTHDRAPVSVARDGREVLPGPKPAWLRRAPYQDRGQAPVAALVADLALHTVCREARCPNLGECFARRTATFLILGDRCTRACRYCAVGHGPPAAPDPAEPARVAEAAARLQLRHVVITSVTRDDLPDGGAAHFAATLAALRRRCPEATSEVLIPDYRGASLQAIWAARPDVLNHNLETVARLFPVVRPGADHGRSLELLAASARAGLRCKSGLMVGLGESVAEVDQTLAALAERGCQIVTIGQYLPPSREHHPASRWVHPDEFARWVVVGQALGLAHVFAGPLVRSSYLAESVWRAVAGTRAGRRGHWTPVS